MHNDKAFYERRLREELQRAATEEEPSLRFLHRRWAELYLDRLARLNDRSLHIAA